MDDLNLTAGQIIRSYKISRQTLGRWVEKGCPKIAKGVYFLPDVIEWRDHDRAHLSSDAMSAAKLMREQAKAKLASLEAQEKEGLLVPKTEAVKWVSLFLVEIKQAIWTLPRRFGAQLAALTDEKEIELLLQAEVRRILEILAHGKRRGMRNEKKQN